MNVFVCAAVLGEYMRERGGGPNDLLFVCLRSGQVYAPQNVRKLIRTTTKRAGLAKRGVPAFASPQFGP